MLIQTVFKHPLPAKRGKAFENRLFLCTASPMPRAKALSTSGKKKMTHIPR